VDGLHPFATHSNSNFAALLLDVVGVPLALTCCRMLLLQKVSANLFFILLVSLTL